MQYILMILKKKEKKTVSSCIILSFIFGWVQTHWKDRIKGAHSEQMIQTLGASKHLIKSHAFPCTGVTTHMEQVSELTFSDFRPAITKVGLFPHRTTGQPQSAFVYSSSYYDCSHESIPIATVHSLEFPWKLKIICCPWLCSFSGILFLNEHDGL